MAKLVSGSKTIQAQSPCSFTTVHLREKEMWKVLQLQVASNTDSADQEISWYRVFNYTEDMI